MPPVDGAAFDGAASCAQFETRNRVWPDARPFPTPYWVEEKLEALRGR